MTVDMRCVDVVYCWVCGEHPRVQESIRQHGLNIPKSRCYSNDLIHMSIQLFLKYSNHVGRIIIVSQSGVVPEGLEHPRITVIDQDDILPSYAVPAFNNMVVECFLQNIPDISEPFVYMNDDYLTINPFDMNQLMKGDNMPHIYRNSHTMDQFVFTNAGSTWDRMMIRNAIRSMKTFGRPLSDMRMMQHML